MTRSSSAKAQGTSGLISGCERCIDLLRELLSLHLEMDPRDRQLSGTEDDIVLRMRKIALHVRAVVDCEIDRVAMHTLAPEIRAANEQIHKTRKGKAERYLLELRGPDISRVRREVRDLEDRTKRSLSPYVHPTSIRLGLPQAQGSLTSANEQWYFFQMFSVLFDLASDYAWILTYFCQVIGQRHVDEIVSLCEKLQKEANRCVALMRGETVLVQGGRGLDAPRP